MRPWIRAALNKEEMNKTFANHYRWLYKWA